MVRLNAPLYNTAELASKSNLRIDEPEVFSSGYDCLGGNCSVCCCVCFGPGSPASRDIMAPYIGSEIPNKERIQVISLHSPLFNLFSHWL